MTADLIAALETRLDQIRQNGGSHYRYGRRDQELDREILKVLTAHKLADAMIEEEKKHA